jgi:hypothetical protein
VIRYVYCFCQGVVESFHSCNFGWSASPPTSWDNSVLCAAHSPMRLAQQSAAPGLGGSLSTPPLLWKLIQHSTLPPLTVGELYSLCMSFSFVGRRVQSAQKLHWIMCLGEHVVCSTHLLGLQIHTGRVESRLARKNSR